MRRMIPQKDIEKLNIVTNYLPDNEIPEVYLTQGSYNVDQSYITGSLDEESGTFYVGIVDSATDWLVISPLACSFTYCLTFSTNLAFKRSLTSLALHIIATFDSAVITLIGIDAVCAFEHNVQVFLGNNSRIIYIAKN